MPSAHTTSASSASEPRWAQRAHARAYSSSRKQFQRALSNAAAGTAAYAMLRAMLMVFEGDVDEATRRLRAALRAPLAEAERAYVGDLLVDALIESDRLEEAAATLAQLPDEPHTRALRAAHRLRLGAHRAARHRYREGARTLQFAVDDAAAQFGRLILYRLADASLRAGDERAVAALVSSAQILPPAGDDDRIAALLLHLRAQVKLRQGLYRSAFEFVERAHAIARKLDERTLLARTLTTTMRIAADAGDFDRYASARSDLARIGAINSIDPLETATAEALRDLCAGQFQVAVRRLSSVHVRDVPSEFQRELLGYRALADFGRRRIREARAYVAAALKPMPARRGRGVDARALRRARLLAGCVLYATGSRARALRLLRATQLLESPEGLVALAMLNGRLADLAPRSGIARAIACAMRGAGAFAALAPRQVEIAALLAAGGSTAAIATELGVSATTVKTQLRRLYRHLGVHKRTDAIKVLSGGISGRRLPFVRGVRTGR